MPSADGPLVYKWALKWIAGHSSTQPVQSTGFRFSRRTAFANAWLDEFGDRADGARVSRTRLASLERQRAARAARAEALAARPGLLVADLSDGQETVAVPVFNETGDGATLDASLPAGFRYAVSLRGCVSAAAAAALALPQSAFHLRPVEAAVDSRTAYNSSGLLKFSADAVEEKENERYRDSVVSAGIELPLEVYRTPNGLGWGVRCSDPILAGQFVVEYVGAVMTDCEVEQLRTDWAPDSPALSYLFDLSHYYDKEAAEAAEEAARKEGGIFFLMLLLQVH